MVIKECEDYVWNCPFMDIIAAGKVRRKATKSNMMTTEKMQGSREEL